MPVLSAADKERACAGVCIALYGGLSHVRPPGDAHEGDTTQPEGCLVDSGGKGHISEAVLMNRHKSLKRDNNGNIGSDCGRAILNPLWLTDSLTNKDLTYIISLY